MWNSSAFQSGSKSAGGFLSSQSPGGAAGSVEKKRPDRINNIVPVTVACLLKTSEADEHARIGSLQAQMITVVGIVRAIEEQSTRATYMVDDMTSRPVEVHMWLGEKETVPTGKQGYVNEKRLPIIEDTYVRVTGVLRFVKGKPTVNAFKVVPIKNFNEVTMHIIEVVHVSMSIAVMDAQSTKESSGNIASEYSKGSESDSNFRGLTKIQQVVYQAIASCTTDAGVSYSYLFSAIKTLNKQTIRETVEFLSNEGHIYSTIDEEHFKTTDS